MRLRAISSSTVVVAVLSIGTASAQPASAPSIDQLKAGLLTYGDMSYTWTRHHENSGASPVCNKVNRYAVDTFAGVYFTRGTRTFADDLGGYRSVSRATKAFTTIRRHASSCTSYTDADGYTFSLRKVASPGLGDRSFALRVKVSRPDGSHYYWFESYTQDGQVLLSAAFSPPGDGIPPRSDAMKLIRKAYAKEHAAL